MRGEKRQSWNDLQVRALLAQAQPFLECQRLQLPVELVFHYRLPHGDGSSGTGLRPIMQTNKPAVLRLDILAELAVRQRDRGFDNRLEIRHIQLRGFHQRERRDRLGLDPGGGGRIGE